MDTSSTMNVSNVPISSIDIQNKDLQKIYPMEFASLKEIKQNVRAWEPESNSEIPGPSSTIEDWFNTGVRGMDDPIMSEQPQPTKPSDQVSRLEEHKVNSLLKQEHSLDKRLTTIPEQ